MQWLNPMVTLIYPLGICLFPMVFTDQADGQDRRLVALFGRGAHAYHAGNIQEASRYLGQALEEGSQDPRCYYFRGLCLLSLGEPDQADQDFRAGAIREFSGLGTYDVSRSLQRVQGAARLELERSRRRVRRELAERDRRRIRRQPLRAAPDDSALAKLAVSPESLSADPNDPFVQADLGPFGEGPVVAQSEASTAQEVAADTDPFGVEDPFGEAAGDETDTDDALADVFGESDAGPANSEPTGAQAASTGGGLFGSLMRGISRVVTGSRSETVTVSPELPRDNGAMSEEADDIFGADVFGEDSTDDMFGVPDGPTGTAPPSAPPVRRTQPSPNADRSETITGPRSLIDRIRGMMPGQPTESSPRPRPSPNARPSGGPRPAAPSSDDVDDIFSDFGDGPVGSNETSGDASQDAAPAGAAPAGRTDSSDDLQEADLQENPFEDDPLQ